MRFPRASSTVPDARRRFIALRHSPSKLLGNATRMGILPHAEVPHDFDRIVNILHRIRKRHPKNRPSRPRIRLRQHQPRHPHRRDRPMMHRLWIGEEEQRTEEFFVETREWRARSHSHSMPAPQPCPTQNENAVTLAIALVRGVR